MRTILARYVGNRERFRSEIQKASREKGGACTTYKTAAELLCDLEEEARSPNLQVDFEGMIDYLHDRQAVTLLDLEMHPINVASVIRAIRRIDAGASVIVIDELSLLGVSLARLEGAEAHLSRRMRSLRPLHRALAGIWAREERWRRKLKRAHRESANCFPRCATIQQVDSPRLGPGEM